MWGFQGHGHFRMVLLQVRGGKQKEGNKIEWNWEGVPLPRVLHVHSAGLTEVCQGTSPLTLLIFSPAPGPGECVPQETENAPQVSGPAGDLLKWIKARDIPSKPNSLEIGCPGRKLYGQNMLFGQ